MHFKGYIITKEIPTEEKLEKILEPYYYENDKESLISWDWWQIGGRFGGKIKIKFDPNTNEDNWYCFHDRNHKYFICSMLDKIKENLKFYEELDILQYMGLSEHTLYVDGGYYNDMIDFDITDCYMVIDDEEKLYLAESWNGTDFKQNDEYEKQLKQIDLKDKFITIIDFHE